MADELALPIQLEKLVAEASPLKGEIRVKENELLRVAELINRLQMRMEAVAQVKSTFQ